MTANPYTAVYLMSDEQLREETEKATERINELSQEATKRSKWSPEFRLSIRLHSVMCGHRDCDFNYQFGPTGTTANVAEPIQYLKMASEMTRHFTLEQIEKLITIMVRR